MFIESEGHLGFPHSAGSICSSPSAFQLGRPVSYKHLAPNGADRNVRH
jgi:hypothetical protein